MVHLRDPCLRFLENQDFFRGAICKGSLFGILQRTIKNEKQTSKPFKTQANEGMLTQHVLQTCCALFLYTSFLHMIYTNPCCFFLAFSVVLLALAPQTGHYKIKNQKHTTPNLLIPFNDIQIFMIQDHEISTKKNSNQKHFNKNRT